MQRQGCRLNPWLELRQACFIISGIAGLEPFAYRSCEGIFPVFQLCILSQLLMPAKEYKLFRSSSHICKELTRIVQLAHASS
jgi:hypothetical protein